jgi:hypothetical protein
MQSPLADAQYASRIVELYLRLTMPETRKKSPHFAQSPTMRWHAARDADAKTFADYDFF